MRAYGKLLRQHKVHAVGRVTYIKLNDQLSYGKQEFRPGPALADEEIINVKAWRNSEEVAVIIREELVENAEPLADAGVAPDPRDEAVQSQPVQPQPVQSAPEPMQAQPPQSTARPAQPSPTRSPLPTPGARPMPTVGPLQGVPAPRPAPVAPAARAVGTISAAVARPAQAPPSARVVQHPSAVQPQDVQSENVGKNNFQQNENVELESQGDGDPIQVAMDSKFQELMGGKLKS